MTTLGQRWQKVVQLAECWRWADYVAKHTDGAGFDVVYDSVGGANMINSFEAAALNGNVTTTVSLLELDLLTRQIFM